MCARVFVQIVQMCDYVCMRVNVCKCVSVLDMCMWTVCMCVAVHKCTRANVWLCVHVYVHVCECVHVCEGM